MSAAAHRLVRRLRSLGGVPVAPEAPAGVGAVGPGDWPWLAVLQSRELRVLGAAAGRRVFDRSGADDLDPRQALIEAGLGPAARTQLVELLGTFAGREDGQRLCELLVRDPEVTALDWSRAVRAGTLDARLLRWPGLTTAMVLDLTAGLLPDGDGWPEATGCPSQLLGTLGAGVPLTRASERPDGASTHGPDRAEAEGRAADPIVDHDRLARLLALAQPALDMGLVRQPALRGPAVRLLAVRSRGAWRYHRGPHRTPLYDLVRHYAQRPDPRLLIELLADGRAESAIAVLSADLSLAHYRLALRRLTGPGRSLDAAEAPADWAERLAMAAWAGRDHVYDARRVDVWVQRPRPLLTDPSGAPPWHLPEFPTLLGLLGPLGDVALDALFTARAATATDPAVRRLVPRLLTSPDRDIRVRALARLGHPPPRAPRVPPRRAE